MHTWDTKSLKYLEYKAMEPKERLLFCCLVFFTSTVFFKEVGFRSLVHKLAELE
jgi:hypothetical protein